MPVTLLQVGGAQSPVPNAVQRTAGAKSRWIVLIVAWLSSIITLVSLQTVPPLLTLIVQHFQVTYSDAGLLMTLFSIAGIFSIFFGIVSDRVGVKRPGELALVLLAMGSLVVATSTSFELTLMGRVIGGVGSGLIGILSPAIIAQWFPRDDLGKAMGVYGTGLPVAVVISFDLVGRIGILYDWRLPFYIVTGFSMLLLVFFVLIIRDGPLLMEEHKEGGAAAGPSLKSNLTNHEIWKIGIFFSLFLFTWTSFSTWTPTLLNEFRGLDPTYAATLASLPMVGSIFIMPFAGWVSDRLGKRKSLLLIGSSVMTIAMLLIIPESLNSATIVWFLLIGVAFSLISPAVFSLGAEALGPGAAGVSFGILLTCSGVGSTLGPLPIGFIQDTAPSFPLSFASIAAFSGISIIIAFLVKSR